ncbi:15365_t:CDS:2 [Funneliformis geosporum]|uniref:14491_t:CDS:1 n=1 Tax=Funneliformis geosporum TaxID=1117311 RepID=A0A9W4SC23_9GLOM|nr:14491_t:CDS:2 [Funneliformis geosporum]CAI2164074.1 15365_t:CDS:2 [Funneliformis geosporum]
MNPLPSHQNFIQQISQIRRNNINYDVIFIVNRKPNTKKMIGHSLILKVRSSYFQKEFRRMDECNKFDTTNCYQLKFPEYTFELFDIILEFIYGNEIVISTKDPEFILNLMKAANRFQLTNMVEYIQTYIIESQSGWINENIFKLIPVLFDNDDFPQLRTSIIRLICKDTRWFIRFDQFNELSEEFLTKFLQIDDLSIEEFHIWNAVLDWILEKNVNLCQKKKVIQWSDQEVDYCRVALKPFIPFIRFFQISSFKYWDYIHEFDRILPEGLVEEMLKYYFKGSPPTDYPLLPLRNVRKIDSDFISSKQAEIISLWIENKDLKKLFGLEWEFKFNLLYSTRRHGYSIEEFHRNCDNKGATILVIKTNIPEEIIGGFNPVSWSDNESRSNFESEVSPRYSPDDSDENSPMDTGEHPLTISSTVDFSPTNTSSDSNNSSNGEPVELSPIATSSDDNIISPNSPYDNNTITLFEQTDAFLFSFNKGDRNNMGRINSLCMWEFIHNCGECGPCFGTTDLWISPKIVHSTRYNIPYQCLANFGYHRQDSYEINLRDEPGGFQFVDYEVFQVVRV